MGRSASSDTGRSQRTARLRAAHSALHDQYGVNEDALRQSAQRGCARATAQPRQNLDRFIVDDPDRARELMAANNFFFTECEVVAVEIANESQLSSALGALLTVEVNIHYAYSFLVRPRGRSALVLSVEDNDMAATALNTRGFKVLTQRDISR